MSEDESKSLEQQRERFRVALESIRDAVITTEGDGSVSFLNPIAEALTGWSAADALGQPLDAVYRAIDEETREPIRDPLARASGDSARGWRHRVALLRRDGHATAIEEDVAPIRDGEGRASGAVLVFRDVTDRRRAEQTLVDAERRKDEFLATLAHELRNPLAPIRQAVFVSQAPGASDAEKRWSYEVIERQVHHMSLLLDDLLDVSRFSRGRLELHEQRTELGAIVDAALEAARPTIDSKRHVLSVDVPAAAVHFDADPVRLAQVLSNLLTNAAKYMDPGGRIRLAARSTADVVEMEVTDTGIGLSGEALPRIFRMFSQVEATQDRSEGGLGIGLALSRALVELHGGTLEGRSAGLGLGSTFTVRIPRVARERPIPRREAKTMAEGSVRPRRILVADDNLDAAQSLALLLQLDGHETVVAHDGSTALILFGEFHPEVALIDIGMPGMDGYEIARRMRAASNGRAIRLIAVTGWGQERDKERARAAGFDHHCTKPVDPTQLRKLVREDAPA